MATDTSEKELEATIQAYLIDEKRRTSGKLPLAERRKQGLQSRILCG